MQSLGSRPPCTRSNAFEDSLPVHDRRHQSDGCIEFRSDRRECICPDNDPVWRVAPGDARPTCQKCGVEQTYTGIQYGQEWAAPTTDVETPQSTKIITNLVVLLPYVACSTCLHCLHLFQSAPKASYCALSSSSMENIKNSYEECKEGERGIQNIFVRTTARIGTQIGEKTQLRRPSKSNGGNREVIIAQQYLFLERLQMFKGNVEGVAEEHLRANGGNPLEATYVKLRLFGDELAKQYNTVQNSPTAGKLRGALWTACHGVDQVLKYVESQASYHKSMAPPPPPNDANKLQTISERFTLDVCQFEEEEGTSGALKRMTIKFLETDGDNGSELGATLTAPMFKGCTTSLLNTLLTTHGTRDDYRVSCGADVCNRAMNISFSNILNVDCASKSKDRKTIWRQFKVLALVARLAVGLLPDSDARLLRTKVEDGAKFIFWGSSFFELRVQRVLSTVQFAIDTRIFENVNVKGCGVTQEMNALCICSVAMFWDNFIAPLFSDAALTRLETWTKSRRAFEKRKGNAAMDAVAVLKVLEIEAIVANTGCDGAAGILAKLRENWTHSASKIREELVVKANRQLKAKRAIQKAQTTSSFDQLRTAVLNKTLVAVIPSSDTSPSKLSDTVNASHDLPQETKDGRSQWASIFQRMPPTPIKPAYSVICDSEGRYHIAYGHRLADLRDLAFPVKESDALTDLVTEMEVCRALLARGTRDTRATFIGFHCLAPRARQNIILVRTNSVFVAAVASHASTIATLRSEQTITDLGRLQAAIDLRHVATKTKEFEVEGKVPPTGVDPCSDRGNAWLEQQRRKLQKLGDHEKKLSKLTERIQALQAASIAVVSTESEKPTIDAALLKEAWEFQSERLTTNRSAIDHAVHSSRDDVYDDNGKRPVSACLRPTFNPAYGIMGIAFSAALEDALQKTLDIKNPSKSIVADCTTLTTRITMKYLSETMERLNEERNECVQEARAEQMVQARRLGRPDADLSTVGGYQHYIKSNDAVMLFKRVHELISSPLGNLAALQYMKLVIDAVSSEDPESEPILRHPIVVRFMIEAALAWGSNREKRCARRLLEYHYDFNRYKFLSASQLELTDADKGYENDDDSGDSRVTTKQLWGESSDEEYEGCEDEQDEQDEQDEPPELSHAPRGLGCCLERRMK